MRCGIKVSVHDENKNVKSVKSSQQGQHSSWMGRWIAGSQNGCVIAVAGFSARRWCSGRRRCCWKTGVVQCSAVWCSAVEGRSKRQSLQAKWRAQQASKQASSKEQDVSRDLKLTPSSACSA
ncbi:hypothetical protein ONS95_015079 [Cadophora gregata]|uniref:uncharacterized protein n=1 Tax=Cadophora gregata TaxID=51156 RepID=UPI0026DB3720|nr:uncharacterized protein ONS95_015079 [Cadophora gregata]KAK0112986.1 hypothetical protein ONS95_015079 [Cadophora gregata]